MAEKLIDLTRKKENALDNMLWGHFDFWQERKDAVYYDDFDGLQEYIRGHYIYTEVQLDVFKKQFDAEGARILKEKSLEENEQAFADYIGYLGC